MPRFAPHPPVRPAIVTGASSGIGEATARALAAAGHPVALGARRLERCERIATEILDQGGRAVAAPLDVGDPASLKDFVAAAEAALGPIDVVVSNAGDTGMGNAVEIPPEAFAAETRVNLLGAHHLLSLVVPGMIDRGRGDIVFVTSDVIRVPRPGIAAYVASKWGLEGLAQAAQMELEGTGVRASIVRPGPTATGMGSGWDAGEFTDLVQRWVHWGLARHDHFLAPDHVAAAIATVVAMPPGAHVTLLEIQPEAPISPTDEPQGGAPS